MMKLREKFAKGICLALVIAFSASIISSAKILAISPKKQQKSNWCWAACAEMGGRWKHGNKTQQDIVRYIKGPSLPNVGGTIKEIARGATYASASAKFTYGGTFSTSQINNIINNQTNPIIASCFASDNSGHSFVIHGYRTNEVYICDPYTAKSSWVKYSTFLKGYQNRNWQVSAYVV